MRLLVLADPACSFGVSAVDVVLGKVAAAEQWLQKGCLSMDNRLMVLSTLSVVCSQLLHSEASSAVCFKTGKSDTFLAKVQLTLVSISEKI